MQKVTKSTSNIANPKWVTAQEVEALRASTKATHNPVGNELIMLMLYRHSLRESELCKLQLETINLDEAKIFIKKIKNGNEFIHSIAFDELRPITSLLRYPRKKQ